VVLAGRLIYFAELGRIAFTVPHFGKYLRERGRGYLP